MVDLAGLVPLLGVALSVRCEETETPPGKPCSVTVQADRRVQGSGEDQAQDGNALWSVMEVRLLHSPESQG